MDLLTLEDDLYRELKHILCNRSILKVYAEKSIGQVKANHNLNNVRKCMKQIIA